MKVQVKGLLMGGKDVCNLETLRELRKKQHRPGEIFCNRRGGGGGPEYSE